MLGSFIDQKWGKVRKQSEKAVNLENIQNAKPRAGMWQCLPSYLQVDSVRNKGVSNRQTERQDSLRRDILCDYITKTTKSKSRNSSNMESELASSLQRCLQGCGLS